MKFIKNTLKKAAVSGTIITSMFLGNGCATVEEQPNTDEQIKIILSNDFDKDNSASNFERVCFRQALQHVREAAAKKYQDDKTQQAHALKCFDACGGAYIKIANECRYVPSKYDFDKDVCFCNGQQIIPHKKQQIVDAELKACQKICESSNTTDKQYIVNEEQTVKLSECVCKIVEQNNQNKK